MKAGALAPIYLGERHWPGRYVLTSGFWYWTGRRDWNGPVVTCDLNHAQQFVSARHAYEAAREIEALKNFRVKRLEGR